MTKYNIGDRFDLGTYGIVEIVESFEQNGDVHYQCKHLDRANEPVKPVPETELDWHHQQN